MNKTLATKYLNTIKKNKSKYVTLDLLSRDLGYYSEVIAKDLSEFEPMLNFDPGINLKNIIDALEKYVSSFVVEPKKKSVTTIKKGITYQQFIIEKMTIPGGLLDKNISLSEKDLKTLRKLINDELKSLKDSK